MTTVEQMLQRCKRIEIKNEILQSLYDTRDVYISEQKRQMLHGFNRNATLIGKYKNAAYAVRKYSLNSRAGYNNVDLRLTGKFYAGIFVEIRDTEMVVGSEDSKASNLEDKYGDEIFGLSKKFKVPFVDANRKIFAARIARALHLEQQLITA